MDGLVAVQHPRPVRRRTATWPVGRAAGGPGRSSDAPGNPGERGLL